MEVHKLVYDRTLSSIVYLPTVV